MKSIALYGIALLLTHARVASALYDNRDEVLELTSKTFKSQHLAAVEFYAPWCGHCQQLAPEWKKAAKNLKGLITVAAVNCDEDQSLCQTYDIKGFPSIKLFAPSAKRPSAQKKRPTDYQGPRTAKPIVDHLLSMQPSYVKYIKDDASKVKSQKSASIDDFLATENTTLPKVLLFTDKLTTTPLYKALSIDFGRGQMLMGEVKKSETAVAAQFGVNAFPTLIVIPPGRDAIRYQGKLQRESLHTFLKDHALKLTTGQKESKKGSKKQSQKESEAPEEPKAKAIEKVKVTELDSNEVLHRHCIEPSNAICVIAAVHSDNKEESIALLNSLNTETTSSLFRFAWVTEEKASSMIDKLDLVRDLPTLFIIHSSKQLYRPYVGAWDKQGVSRWLDQINSGRVQAWPYTGDLVVSNDQEKPRRDEL